VFVDRTLGKEIKEFYKLRNAIHIDGAIKNAIKYELSSSRRAFRRMWPFTKGIKGFLQTGKLPDDARPRELGAADGEPQTLNSVGSAL
jgi:hypothetical protein